jgi:hypothetical protein
MAVADAPRGSASRLVGRTAARSREAPGLLTPCVDVHSSGGRDAARAGDMDVRRFRVGRVYACRSGAATGERDVLVDHVLGVLRG